MRLGRALKSGVLAGVAAGLLLTLLLFFIVDAIEDTAICYEQAGVPNCQPGDGLVPRWQQKLAFAWAVPLLGIFLGGVFAVFFQGLAPYLPGRSPRAKALALGLMGFYVFPLLPSLALPPLPPGVTVGGQEPLATVDARNSWYAVLLVTAAGALALGVGLYHLLVRRRPSRRTHMVAGPLSLAVMASVSALPFAFFPRGAFEPGGPPGLVALLPLYAAASIGSQLAFWLALALLFGFFRTRAEAREAAPEAPGPA